MTEIRQLREIAKRYPELIAVSSTTGNSWVCYQGGWTPSDYPTRDPRFIEELEKELFRESQQTLAQRWERIVNHLDLK